MANNEYQVLPVLPLKNTILFPGLLLPLSVGRDSSLRAVQAALNTEEKEIILVAQRDPQVDSPGQDDLYTIGTKAVIRKSSRPGEGMLEILVLGMERVVLVKLETAEPYLSAKFRVLESPQDGGSEVEALSGALLELASKAIALAQPQSAAELTRMLAGNEEPVRLAYLLASIFSLDVAREQKLLEAETRVDALRLMHSYLAHELQVLELRQKIASTARDEMSKEQREYLLRQQLRAIQQELGEKDADKAEIDMLRERYENANLPEEAKKEFERELARLERLPAGAPDYHVTRTYLEFVLDLPWNVLTQDNLDLAHAREVLDEDHFGLKEVKQRILEHLSVLKRNPEAKAPILCFVGPPGVGKTSLGQSIARALGRKFARMSLGGIRDEAEIRGHRRTYIGAMPGRILQTLRRVESNDPVIMLDEVDKVGADWRGDPSSALLEVLDPEQNYNFRDNYLDLPFDLSKVMFIATANALEPIPAPLRDRMEILTLSGYTEAQKLHIARNYLLPKQIEANGLNKDELTVDDEALQRIARDYTREAGVRNLEREVGTLCRKVAKQVAEGKPTPIHITADDVPEHLGRPRFFEEVAERIDRPGIATGLTWTPVGGEIIFIEAAAMPSKESQLILTGQLGDVMKESAMAALSYVRSHAEALGLPANIFEGQAVHIHVPAGAIPKDGPSAGVTMVTVLVSLASGHNVRSDVAMTGEITLRGKVMPIGGVKEKVLAAYRSGIKTVILPKKNEQDLMEDLPKELRDQMHFVFVTDIRQVLETAIEGFDKLTTHGKEAGNGHDRHREQERPKRRKVEKAAAKAQ